MAAGLYMDVHVPRAVTIALRKRGVDVLTAQEDGTHVWPDDELLDRATELSRMVVTQDEDFLVEAHRRQELGEPFATVIYGHQLIVSLSDLIRDLEILAQIAEERDVTDQVIYLPLK